MNILDALHRKEVFGPLFKDLATWWAWEVYLLGLFGLEVEDAADRKLWKASTELTKSPAGKVRESFVICGR